MLKKIRQLYRSRATTTLRSAVDFQMKFMLVYAACVHLGLAAISFYFSMPELGVYYLATLLLFVLFARFIDSKSFLLIYFLTYAEITFHLSLIHRLIGVSIAIELYYILLIPISSYIFLMPYRRLFQVLFVCAALLLNIVSYSRVQMTHLDSGHILKVPMDTHTIFTIYCVISAFCMAALQSVFFIRSIINRLSTIKEENITLSHRAHHDALTGLKNRYEMNIRLEHAFLDYKQRHIPCSVCIGDIDKFKNVNDTYGHTTGDYVLKAVADILQKNTRKNDAVGRWGGEEFILLMQGDKTACYNCAEKLRNIIANHTFSYNGRVIPVTITFGVASADSTMQEYINVLEAADALLYEGKKRGRNCTRM